MGLFSGYSETAIDGEWGRGGGFTPLGSRFGKPKVGGSAIGRGVTG